jgi:hypothetical protein
MEDLKQVRNSLDTAVEVFRLARHIYDCVENKEQLIKEQKFAEAADERDNEKAYRAELSRILGITVN